MHQFRSARQAKDYYTAALEGGDYYTAEEQKASWCGELCKRLGLGSEVTAKTFASLVDNRHPLTGETLTQRTNEARTVGYDINFHVPKSVSVVHMVSQDDRILEAIRTSVNETMRELEKQTRTRVRIDKQQSERETGELLWGEFLHPTTRPEDGVPDPHLHVHCVVFNATFDKTENRIKAAHFRDIKRDMPYYEAAFYSRLSWRLGELGYGIERDGKKWEIAGVPESVRQKFSRRTTAIEKLAKKLGITDPKQKAELGAKTRSRKTKRTKVEEMRREWLDRMTPDERKTVEKVVRQTRNPAKQDERAAASDALDQAIAHRFERESVVAEPRLRESALRLGLGNFRPEALQDAAREHRDLLRRREDTQTLVTTRQVLAEEQAMLSFAREGRGACPSLEGNRPWEPGYANLNKQQVRAVGHLLRSRDRVMLLRGGAGTGKTALLRETAKAIESRGKRVTVLAPTAEASRGVLRGAGFEKADTVAKFLSDGELQKSAKDGVIWVDEAALLGTPTMKRLFEAAKQANARVVLCGDSRQHAPIERGDAMRLLESRVGLVPAELTEIVRQRGTYKEAVEAISKGEFDRGVAVLDRLDAIRQLPGTDWVPLVTDYMESVQRGRSSLVVAPTHAVGTEISTLIRSSLQREGRLGQEERLLPQLSDLRWTAGERSDAARYQPGQVVQFHRAAGKGTNAFKPGERLAVSGRDGKGNVLVKGEDGRNRILPVKMAANFTVSEEKLLRVAAGEQLRATGGGKTLDGKHRLNSGVVYQLSGFTPEGNLKLSNGWIVGRDFARLDHGYVATSHAAQGRTVDWVFVAQSRAALGASSAEQFYVSVSRGREGVRVYTDDRAALAAAIAKTSHRRSAVELTGDTSAVERSRRHAATLVRLRQYERQRSRPEQRSREMERGYGR